jgi:hypothetical protein
VRADVGLELIEPGDYSTVHTESGLFSPDAIVITRLGEEDRPFESACPCRADHRLAIRPHSLIEGFTSYHKLKACSRHTICSSIKVASRSG